MKESNERGYTMTEVIGVLSIVGILIVSMSMLVNGMFIKYKSNRVQDQIVSLQKVINQRFVADGNYRNAKNSQLIKEDVVPRDMVYRDDIVQTFGAVKVSPGNITFKIEFSELPRMACINLAIMSWVSQDTSDLVSVTVNKDKYEWPKNAKSEDYSMPITTIQAAKSCKRGDENVIEWEFQ